MFTRKPKSKTTLDEAIDDAIATILVLDPSTEEYAVASANLAVLTKIRNEEKPEKVSADTKALVAANLLGLVLIMTHERTAVIATKALQFVIKPK